MKTLYTKSNALWSCCLVAIVALSAVPTMAQTTFGSFSASPALAIPDATYNGTLGSMGSSAIAVSGVTGTSVINIEVDLNMNHTWVGDLVIKLQAPNGNLLTLVSRPGSAETDDLGTGGAVGTNSDWLGSTLTFTDLGTTDGELLNTPFAGTYFPNPGITSSPTQTFASLFGGTMNGNWTLFIGDRAADDIGTLNSWAIRITTVNPLITVYKTVAVEDGNGDCSDDVEPDLSANSLTVAAGTNVCYFYTAFNDGDIALGLHDVSDDILGPILTATAFDLQPAAGVYVSYGPVTINATVTNEVDWRAYNVGDVDVALGSSIATVTVPSLTNYICEDAFVVGCGSVTAGSTIGAGENEIGGTFNGGTTGAGVWYTFTGTGEDVTFSTCTNTDFDSEINVYWGECVDIFLENGNDDACGSGSSITVSTVLDRAYFIYVSDWTSGGIGGNFELTVACAPPGVGCNNASADGQYPFVNTTPDAGGAVTTIATNQYAGSEYSVIIGIQSGVDYEFTHANGAYITVREGAVSGPIIGAGYSPLTVTANSGADLYVHWNLDNECAVGGTVELFVTTVQLILSSTCDAAAGTLSANDSQVCLVGGSAVISATQGTAPVVPAGYAVAYVLTQGAGLVIVDLAATPSFTVATGGDYTIHTMVYDPADQATLLASSTGFDVNALLIQGGGVLCGSLDVTGAPIQVGACDCNGDLGGNAIIDACGVCSGGNTGIVPSTPFNVTHCYDSNANDQFLYIPTAPGALPSLVINSGEVEAGWDVLTIYDGLNTSAPVLFTGDGDLTGVSVQSTSGYLLVEIITDGSVSCVSGGVATSLDWDVSCGVEGIAGCTNSASINYNPAANIDDGSCVTPTCSNGPLNVTHCYDSNADDQFLYEPLTPGDLPVLVVNSGEVEAGWDTFTIYDGNTTGAPVLFTGDGDVSGVTVQSTSGFLLVQIVSDGSVSCATGDFQGLDWNVYCGATETCETTAGTLTADAAQVCLVGGSATISATEGTAPNVPAGYSVAYVLTIGTGLDVLGVPSLTPNFTVNTAGFYTIHTIVYDPADQAVLLASTTAYQVDALLIQGGGSLCGSLDMIGAPVQVSACDCNGDIDGTAFVDDCATCVGGNTGLVACVADCNGDFEGTAFTDECDNCVGGNTGLTACVEDCEGIWGGPAFIDECATCVGGGTGLVACVADCNGDFGGTAAIDECSVCAGGNTGIEPCVPVGVNDADALANALLVFPNPSNGQFIIELNGVEGKATMNIVDMLGRNVYTQAIVLNGAFRKGINLNVAKGTYVMQVVTVNGIATRKVEVN